MPHAKKIEIQEFLPLRLESSMLEALRALLKNFTKKIARKRRVWTRIVPKHKNIHLTSLSFPKNGRTLQKCV